MKTTVDFFVCIVVCLTTLTTATGETKPAKPATIHPIAVLRGNEHYEVLPRISVHEATDLVTETIARLYTCVETPNLVVSPFATVASAQFATERTRVQDRLFQLIGANQLLNEDDFDHQITAFKRSLGERYNVLSNVQADKANVAMSMTLLWYNDMYPTLAKSGNKLVKGVTGRAHSLPIRMNQYEGYQIALKNGNMLIFPASSEKDLKSMATNMAENGVYFTCYLPKEYPYVRLTIPEIAITNVLDYRAVAELVGANISHEEIITTSSFWLNSEHLIVSEFSTRGEWNHNGKNNRPWEEMDLGSIGDWPYILYPDANFRGLKELKIEPPFCLFITGHRNSIVLVAFIGSIN